MHQGGPIKEAALVKICYHIPLPPSFVSLWCGETIPLHWVEGLGARPCLLLAHIRPCLHTWEIYPSGLLVRIHPRLHTWAIRPSSLLVRICPHLHTWAICPSSLLAEIIHNPVARFLICQWMTGLTRRWNATYLHFMIWSVKESIIQKLLPVVVIVHMQMVPKDQAKRSKPLSLMTRRRKIGLTYVTKGNPACRPNQDEASKRSLIYSMTFRNCWIRLISMLCNKGLNQMTWKGLTEVTLQEWHKRILMKSARSTFMLKLWFGNSVTWYDTTPAANAATARYKS